MIRFLAKIFCVLPLNVSVAIGRCLGCLGYFLFPKKTRTVYLNLKTIFGSSSTHAQLKALTRQVFYHVVISFIELLMFPRIRKEKQGEYVKLNGMEHVHQARLAGKGVIFAAIHAGNWELSSLIGSLQGIPYHIVANRQEKMPELDALLQEYRRIGGASVIIAGETTKDIIRALKNNDILSLAVDMGGKEGQIIPFLGKSASMSTGAVRLALKYGCAVCPVWMTRKDDGHELTVMPPIIPNVTGNEEADTKALLIQVCGVFEKLLFAHPQEYLWFYKFFKYSDIHDVLILDDGRTGHLRQSQAVARALSVSAKSKQKTVRITELKIDYRGKNSQTLLSLFVLLGMVFPFLRGRWMLALTLTPASLIALDKVVPQAVISTGSTNGALNHLLSVLHRAKSIGVLKQGIVPLAIFDRIILPEHDEIKGINGDRLIQTKAAPNLIDKKYLKTNLDSLLNRYSHLKTDVRPKIAVLVGGDTKGVVTKLDTVRQLFTQLKNACDHYNATLLVTTSRRTPPVIEQFVERDMANFKRCGLCIIANHQEIPEAVGGLLGLADIVLVSSESVSMISEAATAGKMTCVYSLHENMAAGAVNKYDAFVKRLQVEGYVVAPTIKEVSSTIAMLMSRKVSLKTLDDQNTLVNGLAGII